MRFALMIAGALTLSCCASQTTYRVSHDPTAACVADLKQSPAGVLMTSKSTVTGFEYVTDAMKADASYPSDAEHLAIHSYRVGSRACYQAGIAYREQHVTLQALQFMDSVHAYSEALGDQLEAGQLTWGQYNTRRSILAEEARRGGNAIDLQERLDARARADAIASVARAVAATAAAGVAHSQTQAQPTPVISAPSQVHCTTMGNQTNCTAN